jgi:hypothetical protein
MRPAGNIPFLPLGRGKRTLRPAREARAHEAELAYDEVLREIMGELKYDKIPSKI